MKELATEKPVVRLSELGCHDCGCRKGRPIVFLHDANKTGASCRDVATLLPDHRAICFGLPATGINRHQVFSTLETCANSVGAAIRGQFLGHRPLEAVISLRAYVGLLLALRRPRLVASATLSGFQIAPLTGSHLILLLSALLSPLMSRISFRQRAARALGIPERSSAWPRPNSPCSALTLCRITRAAVRFDVGRALPDFQVPVLALAGGAEAKPCRDALPQLLVASAKASAALVPGGHAWPAARPGLFARMLVAWVENLALPEGTDTRPVLAEVRPALDA